MNVGQVSSVPVSVVILFGWVLPIGSLLALIIARKTVLLFCRGVLQNRLYLTDTARTSECDAPVIVLYLYHNEVLICPSFTISSQRTHPSRLLTDVNQLWSAIESI